MTDIYNLNWTSEVTNPVDIVTGVGTAIGSPFLIGNIILLSFFLVFQMISLRHDFVEVLIVNGFITTIITILFYYIGFVAATTIIMPFIVLAIALMFKLFG